MLVANRAFAYFRKMFIYFFKIFGCAGSLVFLDQLFSSCSNQGLLSSCNVQTFYCGGFSCCGAQALRTHRLQYLWLVGFRVRVQYLWHMHLTAPWHLGSSWTRDGAHVPCIGRWILYHRTIRAVLATVYRLTSSFILCGLVKSQIIVCVS